MLYLITALAAVTTVFALPTAPTTSPPTITPSSTSTSAPVVVLPYASFQGSTTNNISSYLGMPFAQPPLGDLRFALPLPPLNLGSAVIQATSYGSECSQQSFASGYADGLPTSTVDTIQALPGLNSTQSGQEDCLTINIQAPANIPDGVLLPIVVWVYGGGFEYGSTSGSDGAPIVARSIALGTPVIYISMNYRVSAFGFMASKEIKLAEAGNAGVADVRLALRWIQQYAAKFGGDPSKVTAWGESAGSILIALNMVAYNGDLTKPTTAGSSTPLFRGAFMESGAQLPTGSILNGQEYYDSMALAVGCINTDAAASLDCMRHAPYNDILAAMNQTPGLLSYQSLRNAWLPRTDGIMIAEDAQQLVEDGKIANIPFILGDCDDEGTLFATGSVNITTDSEALSYFQINFLLGSTDSEIADLALHYPRDPTLGSPFDTGYLNQLTPQFKRIAAFIGDYVFQAPRRFFLNKVNSIGLVPTWSYIYKRNKAAPFLGSFHSSELTKEFYFPKTGGSTDFEMIDYLINFTDHLDPNPLVVNSNSGILYWPKWTSSSPKMMTFLDRPLGGVLGLAITLDTYRQEAMEYVTVLSRKYPM